MRQRLERQLRGRSAGRKAVLVVGGGTGLVLVAILAEAVWMAIPPMGVLAVLFAARLRRKLRAAAAEREDQLRRERDVETRLRLIAARLEVATEVHDAVAHRLIDINTRAGVAAHLGSGDSGNALEDIKKVSAQALADLRATLSVMRRRDDDAVLALTPVSPGEARRWRSPASSNDRPG